MSEFNERMNRLAKLANLLESASEAGHKVSVKWTAEGALELAEDLQYMIRYAQHGHIAQISAARQKIEEEAKP